MGGLALCGARGEVPSTPQVSAAHREFLSRLARRTIEDGLKNLGVHEPEYVPEALSSTTAECVVRVRHAGFLLSVGVGGPGPLAAAVRDAASAAVQSIAPEDRVAASDSEAWLVEVEVLGATSALPEGIDWTQAAAIDAFVEPGIDGLLVLTPGRARRVCPSEFVTSDLALSDAVRLLAQALQLGPDQVRRTPLMLFRTAHWYEASKGARPVGLYRGGAVVPGSDVTAAGLADSVDRIAEYMVYRQRSTGLFAYQFEPGADRYSDEDNLVRQVGATLALAVHARERGRSASLAAADSAIRYHLQGLTNLPGHDDAAFIATADGRNKLGVTALLSMALAEHPRREQYAEVRRKLVKGILALQASTGMFVTAFPPATQLGGQEYFPGEALLALAADYDLHPTGEVLAAFDRAIEFYRDYFNASRSASFVPWQVRAFALMAKHTKRKDYQDYVFELSDWLAGKQLTAKNQEWAELSGGVAALGAGRAGVATASYLEAFADALTLARALGDKKRIGRYEEVVRGAARFVMQLQVRPEEAYFARSPQDMIGGVRAGPALNRLRIDHCQHALVGLWKARQALFPSDG